MDNILRRDYERTDTECETCEDGNLWVNSYELCCESCDTVVRKGSEPEQRMTPFEEFRRDRDKILNEDVEDIKKYHTYDNSNETIMIGGFFEAYRGDGIYGD